MMPFCKHVVTKVILVPFSFNLTVKTGFSRSWGGDNKQCGHFFESRNFYLVTIYRLNTISRVILWTRGSFDAPEVEIEL